MLPPPSPPHIYVHYHTEQFKISVEQVLQSFQLTFKVSLQALSIDIEKGGRATVVIEIHDNFTKVKTFVLKHKKNKNCPIIAIIPREVRDTIRRCGKIGIDRVLTFEEIKDLEKTHQELWNPSEPNVRLKDISIDLEDVSCHTVKQILAFIEDNYLNISTVEDLSGMLNINTRQVNRKFTRQALTSPKKILTCLKARHALKLMAPDQDHSLEDISDSSDFDSYQQFRKTLLRLFKQSPSRVQQKVKQVGDEAFWQKKTKKHPG